ncbi:hypothetical protein PC117_g14051 [Phytophthora cactorum]|uniref:Uncharacterized protein n=1 Tax=Phytophthora cactorum TaxID=29920 RepID=A0A8T1CUG8_9STRA|nr:hypothetical protein PC117_g14051 [Phytophthora cactorum]
MKRHPDYLSTMKLSGFNSGTLVTFIDQKSQTIYSWLILITECNHPFSFCENPTVAKYTVLPSTFGIIIDDCIFLSEHFVAIFAVFDHNGGVEKVFLSMAPIMDDITDDHTAKSMSHFWRAFCRSTSRS